MALSRPEEPSFRSPGFPKILASTATDASSSEATGWIDF